MRALMRAQANVSLVEGGGLWVSISPTPLVTTIAQPTESSLVSHLNEKDK